MSILTSEQALQASEEATAPVAEGEAQLIEEDLLVEEISIDGMCGVY